ncbi:DUF563 domain-containing protein [Pseudoroseicyclus sp. CXY001]|uniref:glycosyltransferase family 61 protein n=1 Tax=Pseudoroseicyclus sp. CXY001 TaxID=3242492 RepID=UPI003570C73B
MTEPDRPTEEADRDAAAGLVGRPLPIRPMVEIAGAERIAELLPAGGYVRAPILRRRGIATAFDDELQRSRGARIETPPVEAWRLRDAIVLDLGIVISAGGEVVRESLAELKIPQDGPNYACDGESLTLKSPPQGRFPRGHLLKKRGARNYGHWLAELLVREEALRQAGLPHGWPLVHKSRHAELTELYRRSLQMLGAPPPHPCGPEPLSVDDLTLVTGLSAHPDRKHPLLREMAARLRRVAAAEGATGLGERLLVTRAAGHGRGFANREAVHAYFTDRGFRIIEPQSLSFPEQIAAFGAAKEVWGIMGAAMTNTLFAPPEARIGYIASAHMNGQFFADQEAIAGRDAFNVLFCAPVSGSGPSSPRGNINDKITVDLAALEALRAEMLPAAPAPAPPPPLVRRLMKRLRRRRSGA